MFHVTKPSVVAGASIPGRVLLLVAAPAPFLMILLPAVLLAAVDAVRPRRKTCWIAAITPAAIATSLIVVAADNFAHTLFGVGIVDTETYARTYSLLGAAAVFAFLLQSEARAIGETPTRGKAGIAAAVLATVSVVAFLVTTIGRGSERTAQSPESPQNLAAVNFLLIGIDGLDAKDLSPYEPSRKTPTIQALAERGLVFENAFANAGRTYGSLISLLTGKQATRTRILFPPRYLTGHDAIEHAPALLRAAGYRNAQIGVRHYLDAEDWNMRGGFHVVNSRVQSALPEDRSELHERLRRFQLEVLERVGDRVLHLLFVRTMEDPNRFLLSNAFAPQFADERRLKMAVPFIEARPEPWLLQIHLVETHCCAPDHETRVRAADERVGRLLNLLERTGQLGRTAIFLYADHTHWSETLGRIPLIVAGPGVPTGRVRANAQLLDIAPTMLAMANVPKPQWMSGQSLLEFQAWPADRPIFSLVDLGTVKTSGPRRLVAADARPPYYGARSAAVVVCDQWAKLEFPTRRITRGNVMGHTAPCASSEDIAPFLVRHLREHDYPVDDLQP